MPVVTAFVVGIGLGIFMIRQYDDREKFTVTSFEGKKISFLQIGVYSSEESKNEHTATLPSYIYEQKDGKYYVYIALTQDQENAQKLKAYFEENGYHIYIKEFMITNKQFLQELKQYDTMLSQAETSNYPSICNQVLKRYEELVTNDGQVKGTTPNGST